MIIFFSWVIWIWIVITVFADLFRRHDISGWGKAAWVVFVIVVPFLGVLVYLIAQHDGMRDRTCSRPRARSRRSTNTCARRRVGPPPARSPRPRSCSTGGAITQAEFDALKAKALAQSESAYRNDRWP